MRFFFEKVNKNSLSNEEKKFVSNTFVKFFSSLNNVKETECLNGIKPKQAKPALFQRTQSNLKIEMLDKEYFYIV